MDLPGRKHQREAHGSQGPMFVIGGSVAGGVYGNHANIDPAALDDQENTPYSQAAGDGIHHGPVTCRTN